MGHPIHGDKTLEMNDDTEERDMWLISSSFEFLGREEFFYLIIILVQYLYAWYFEI